jgi:hydrogenase/urease accessory protein HupE
LICERKNDGGCVRNRRFITLGQIFNPVISGRTIGRRVRGIFAVSALAVTFVAHAHDPGLSTATVRLGPDKVEAEVVLSGADAGTLFNLDKIQSGRFSKDQLEFVTPKLRDTFSDPLEIKLDGQPAQPVDTQCSVSGRDSLTIYLFFPAKSFTNLIVQAKWLALLATGHRQYLSVQNERGEILTERLLSAASDSATIDLSAVETKPATQAGVNSFWNFLVMGVKHIWTGYDHLLFLFGLLIVTRNFKDSIKIITCFTIAHSITLAIATLNFVQIPSRIVEPLIAASIVYVGLENLFRGGEPRGRWLLTFAFGLIHGFGFASVLRELGVGANGSSIAIPLISFNLGVELGQIAIAALALPLIWKLRTQPVFIRRWVPACSTLVALLGGFWFVQRVWF